MTHYINLDDLTKMIKDKMTTSKGFKDHQKENAYKEKLSYFLLRKINSKYFNLLYNYFKQDNVHLVAGMNFKALSSNLDLKNQRYDQTFKFGDLGITRDNDFLKEDCIAKDYAYRLSTYLAEALLYYVPEQKPKKTKDLFLTEVKVNDISILDIVKDEVDSKHQELIDKIFGDYSLLLYKELDIDFETFMLLNSYRNEICSLVDKCKDLGERNGLIRINRYSHKYIFNQDENKQEKVDEIMDCYDKMNRLGFLASTYNEMRTSKARSEIRLKYSDPLIGLLKPYLNLRPYSLDVIPESYYKDQVKIVNKLFSEYFYNRLIGNKEKNLYLSLLLPRTFRSFDLLFDHITKNYQ